MHQHVKYLENYCAKFHSSTVLYCIMSPILLPVLKMSKLRPGELNVFLKVTLMDNESICLAFVTEGSVNETLL